ncbi:hypothetical protein NWX04_003761 [Salmonella enterica]|nr:hypothetical protein [Salmonella enterica]EKA1340885.1 hypothetical protein [Salmonella enterica]
MMSSITKSIQNEYVLLMENAFSEKYKYAFRNLELKELRRFILKELISSPDKNEIQMLEKTPVSLLYGAYKKK